MTRIENLLNEARKAYTELELLGRQFHGTPQGDHARLTADALGKAIIEVCKATAEMAKYQDMEHAIDTIAHYQAIAHGQRRREIA